MTDQHRVVIVAPLVPYDAPPHAGGRYLQSVVRFAETLGPTTVLVANTPTSRATATAPGAPRQLYVVGSIRPTAIGARIVNRAVAVADSWVRRVDPGLPSLPLALGLVRKGPAREALAHADVVDLQWAQCVRLVRLVRRLSPSARVVGTYHDVLSQAFARYPARRRLERIHRTFIRHRATRHERRAVQILDEAAVFSRKDAHLLGDPANVRVIHPPLATGDEVFPNPPEGPPSVICVADFSRPENDDAAVWLLREVWPIVARTLPDACLRLVGRGASDQVSALVERQDHVMTTGFVDDLGLEYAAASLAVVPLRRGAGVKFKTIEALLHGVPVVATPVGVEGIDGPDLFAEVTDDPRALAAAMVAAMSDPGPARDRARAAQTWAVHAYSRLSFENNMREHYGIG